MIIIVQDEGSWFEERTYCRVFGLCNRWGWDPQVNWVVNLNGAQIDGVIYGTIVNSDNKLMEPNSILHQNYPNPFNPTTTIDFSIQNDSNVKLAIYNIKGQKVRALTNEFIVKGLHSIIWNGDDDSGDSVSSGVYLYKINVNGKTEAVKKCMLLK